MDPQGPPSGRPAGAPVQSKTTGTTTVTSSSTSLSTVTSTKTSTARVTTISSTELVTSTTQTTSIFESTDPYPSSAQSTASNTDVGSLSTSTDTLGASTGTLSTSIDSLSVDTTPSSTLQVSSSINVSVTLQTTLPAGAIGSLPNTSRLSTGVGVAIGISAFLLFTVFFTLALLWFRRKRRRAAEWDQDSWANSSIRPEVVRRQSTEASEPDLFPQTTAAPRIPSTVIPPASPADPFLSPEERVTIVGTTPSVEMRQSKPVLPARTPSRTSFHRISGDGGAAAGTKIRNTLGNGNENAFNKSNKSSWRVSGDLTPPIEVPKEMTQERPKTEPNPSTPASPPNVRMSGRVRSQSAGNGGRGEGQDLPESLGKLNRWLEDNRRRSRI